MPRRLMESTLINSFVPKHFTCVRCLEPVEETTAIYGRYATSWFSKTSVKLDHIVTPQQVIIIPIVKEVRIPKMVKGLFCRKCYTELWAITWRDKNNHLRHAIDVLHRPFIQHDDPKEELAPITKGLYAPHAVGGRGSKGDNSRKSSMILDERDIKVNHSRRLAGFDRLPKDRKHRSSPGRTLVHKGHPIRKGGKEAIKDQQARERSRRKVSKR